MMSKIFDLIYANIILLNIMYKLVNVIKLTNSLFLLIGIYCSINNDNVIH